MNAPARLAICIFAALALQTRAADAAGCESLAGMTLAQTMIAQAQPIAAGDFSPPTGSKIAGLPAFCRVAGSVKPTADSDIRFEVWAPSAGWNGKILMIGNGGLAGSIVYGNARIQGGGLAAALRSGYAAVSTDTGHVSDMTDDVWAPGHPEKVIDFGYRGIHEVAVKTKAIVEILYGRPAQHAYFQGCSNGGRQALMEAQRYAGDFDGLIAGAAANNTHIADILAYDHLESGTIEALDPNLLPFKRRGGKIIEYHGGADPMIPPEFSTYYYDVVAQSQGVPSKSGGLRRTRDFYRLFIVPELGHCGGGQGLNDTLLTALENWVERDTPPDGIDATYRLGNPLKESVVERHRVLCPYPDKLSENSAKPGCAAGD